MVQAIDAIGYIHPVAVGHAVQCGHGHMVRCLLLETLQGYDSKHILLDVVLKCGYLTGLIQSL